VIAVTAALALHGAAQAALPEPTPALPSSGFASVDSATVGSCFRCENIFFDTRTGTNFTLSGFTGLGNGEAVVDIRLPYVRSTASSSISSTFQNAAIVSAGLNYAIRYSARTDHAIDVLVVDQVRAFALDPRLTGVGPLGLDTAGYAFSSVGLYSSLDLVDDGSTTIFLDKAEVYGRNGGEGGYNTHRLTLMTNTVYYVSLRTAATAFLGGYGSAIADPMFTYSVDDFPDVTFEISEGAGNATGFGLGGVPEPATWAMLLTGFSLAGAAVRRRRTALRGA